MFKIGDDVKDIFNVESQIVGKIVNIDYSELYPIQVYYDEIDVLAIYTLSGIRFGKRVPTLYLKNTINSYNC